MAAAAGRVNLLVVASPEAPELSVLQRLPPHVKVVGTGQTLADLASQLRSGEQWGGVDAMLICGVGKLAGKHIQEFWPRLSGLKWLHSCSAGLEHLLFPELVQSSVVLTNARGVYSHSLAE
jgi:phosphoglycerate dehydrogenase-like enzyme